MSKASVTNEIRLALRELGPGLRELNDQVGSHIDLKAIDIQSLDHLGMHGPMAPGELAARMGSHPATMTGILDRLERGGWVARERDPDDRRKVVVRAIRTRAPELVDLYSPMNEKIGRICAERTADELEVIRDFLRAISAAARDASDHLRGRPG